MVENGPKWYKIVKNCEKWSKWSKMVKIAKNGLKSSKMVQNVLKWSKKVQNGRNSQKLTTFPNMVKRSKKHRKWSKWYNKRVKDGGPDVPA